MAAEDDGKAPSSVEAVRRALADRARLLRLLALGSAIAERPRKG